MKRQMSALAGVILTAAATCACNRSSAAAAVAEPPAANGCSTALAPGAERSDSDREIARVQQDARGGAHARAALERLGYVYVKRARINNDAGDYKLAEATADCLDAQYPGSAAALLLRGHVFHQLHPFPDAEQIARALVAQRNVVLDYGLLGDALMEQGRLAEAASAYQKMIDLKPFYQSYTRAAHMRWLKGDLAGAIEAMRLAIDSASPRDAESSAWAWTRLAAYELQAGRLEDAAKAVETALRYQPDYAAALLEHGRTLLAMKRRPEAADTLRRAAQFNPLPEYQWALADALRAQGLDAEAEKVERDMAVRGASADPRTFALYLATRGTEPVKAVALAEEELRARADVFTLDAHAWALASAGRIAEAREDIGRAVAEGTRDARLFLHAGVIHAAAGDPREAKRWLRKAQRLSATLLPSEADYLAKYLTNNH
jgi:tetratricopeptide (TPR) repeat protein